MEIIFCVISYKLRETQFPNGTCGPWLSIINPKLHIVNDFYNLHTIGSKKPQNVMSILFKTP